MNTIHFLEIIHYRDSITKKTTKITWNFCGIYWNFCGINWNFCGIYWNFLRNLLELLRNLLELLGMIPGLLRSNFLGNARDSSGIIRDLCGGYKFFLSWIIDIRQRLDTEFDARLEAIYIYNSTDTVPNAGYPVIYIMQPIFA